MIDLDVTFFYQFVNFVIILIVLNFLLVRPIRDIIKKRNDVLAGYVSEAERFTAEADEKLKNYNAALDEAKAAGVEERNQFKDQGTAEEQGIVQAAGDEALAALKAERGEIASESGTARDALKGQVGALASQMVDKVLG
ncbi:MAG: ATP synthase F0 subunit B [Thermodesulfobacteriota bacterium]|nr:ATP synthase F0 subunit B [Thermodesulfobacteriota bacterium]